MSEVILSDFAGLGLAAPVLRAVQEAGYSSPTPIQARTIPTLLSGGDLLGQAQTGTGKTAAFTLPLLSRLAVDQGRPAILVLTPTRELAIQVAQAMTTYGQFVRGLRVLPIYGGASFVPQLRGLKAGATVVVGTPGRVMDHMRRGTLDLSGLQALVLDEADEMLKMGFIDDVEWILEQAPENRQIALFSATMPAEIRRIAGRYLREATHVVIEKATTTADTIRQRYVLCRPHQKIQALTHLLDVEDTDGVLVFVRTRGATADVAQALQKCGYRGAALCGDVAQRQREEIVEQLRAGELKLIVATDVAARGLDVSRISHVINFDIADDPETYVHRIGRTGRAGRAGEAILLVTPREIGGLRRLERAIRQKLGQFEFPTRDELRVRRTEKLKQELARVLDADGIDELETVVGEYAAEQGISLQRMAAALVRELRSGEPLTPAETGFQPLDASRQRRRDRHDHRNEPRAARWRAQHDAQRRHSGGKAAGALNENVAARNVGKTKVRSGSQGSAPLKRTRRALPVPQGMDRYRMEVGRCHGVEPRHIVGAIAGETGLRGRDIGRVEIRGDCSFVDLPLGMPREVLRTLKRTWVVQQQLCMTKVGRQEIQV